MAPVLGEGDRLVWNIDAQSQLRELHRKHMSRATSCLDPGSNRDAKHTRWAESERGSCDHSRPGGPESGTNGLHEEQRSGEGDETNRRARGCRSQSVVSLRDLSDGTGVGEEVSGD